MQNQLIKFTIPLVLASFAFSGELTTKEQKESYSIGASTGSYISNQLHNHTKMGVGSDVNLVIEGFLDAFKNQLKLKDDEIITLLNERAEKLNKAAEKQAKEEIDKNLKIGRDYMAKNAKNPKVKTTKSGLQYEVLSEGKGDMPKPESIVVVNYKGSLTDGTVFEDTYAQKMPAHLSMISIIEGLGEGFKLMKTGSKYKFVIPPNLAYGNDGAGEIPGGSTIIFEAELIKVLKPGELAGAAKELSESEIKNFHGTPQTK